MPWGWQTPPGIRAETDPGPLSFHLLKLRARDFGAMRIVAARAKLSREVWPRPWQSLRACRSVHSV